MPDDFRVPVERGHTDTRAVSVVVEHIGNSVREALVGDDSYVPELAREQLVENNDVARLPLGEVFHITRNHLVREGFCFLGEEYINILHPTEVDVRVVISWIRIGILRDIGFEERFEIEPNGLECPPDNVAADSRARRRISTIAVVSIRKIIHLHHSNLRECPAIKCPSTRRGEFGNCYGRSPEAFLCRFRMGRRMLEEKDIPEREESEEKEKISEKSHNSLHGLRIKMMEICRSGF